MSAPPMRQASASAAAADAVLLEPAARPEAWRQLPAPHGTPAGAPWPAVHEPTDLRRLVGRRDARDPFAVAAAWARDLGATIEGTTGPELVAWAQRTHRVASPTAAARPGDLVVFDHVTDDDRSDLIAIAIATDVRGVTELIYLGGGVVRRGFVDASRKSIRRDRDGKIVNTFLRTGKRWPPRGTRYLAGELLGAVVHSRAN